MHAVYGDLLSGAEQVVCQQLNCLTTKPHGLSASLARRYPYSNVYAMRKQSLAINNRCTRDSEGIPGTANFCNGLRGPIVAGLFAQHDFGRPGTRTPCHQDSAEMRRVWFASALQDVRSFMIKHNLKSIGIPYMIGCGLAGGDWEVYRKMLDEFAKDAPFTVRLYRLHN